MYVCGFSLFAGLASVVCIHGGRGRHGLIYNVGWCVFTAPVKGRWQRGYKLVAVAWPVAAP